MMSSAKLGNPESSLSSAPQSASLLCPNKQEIISKVNCKACIENKKQRGISNKKQREWHH